MTSKVEVLGTQIYNHFLLKSLGLFVGCRPYLCTVVNPSFHLPLNSFNWLDSSLKCFNRLSPLPLNTVNCWVSFHFSIIKSANNFNVSGNHMSFHIFAVHFTPPGTVITRLGRHFPAMRVGKGHLAWLELVLAKGGSSFCCKPCVCFVCLSTLVETYCFSREFARRVSHDLEFLPLGLVWVNWLMVKISTYIWSLSQKWLLLLLQPPIFTDCCYSHSWQTLYTLMPRQPPRTFLP